MKSAMPIFLNSFENRLRELEDQPVFTVTRRPK